MYVCVEVFFSLLNSTSWKPFDMSICRHFISFQWYYIIFHYIKLTIYLLLLRDYLSHCQSFPNINNTAIIVYTYYFLIHVFLIHTSIRKTPKNGTAGSTSNCYFTFNSYFKLSSTEITHNVWQHLVTHILTTQHIIMVSKFSLNLILS